MEKYAMENFMENMQENMQENTQNIPGMPKICQICTPQLADARQPIQVAKLDSKHIGHLEVHLE